MMHVLYSLGLLWIGAAAGFGMGLFWRGASDANRRYDDAMAEHLAQRLLERGP